MTNTPNDLPDRPLTPAELFALVESNLRLARANSEAIERMREEFQADIRETRAIADSNARAIAANSDYIAQNSRDISALGDRLEGTRQRIEETNNSLNRLEAIVEQYFGYQAGMNRILDGGLEDHEQRLRRLEGEGEGD